MASWFSSATGINIDGALSTLTDTVSKAAAEVSNVIPEEHKDFIKKLTLNTDEMINERLSIKEEALRKQAALQRLGELLPWETNDKERDILVEECKDAILLLSKNEETFFGPYEMPMLTVQLEDDEEDDEDEERGGGGRDDDGEDDGEVVGRAETEEEDVENKDGEGETPTTKDDDEDEEEEEDGPVRKPQYHMKPSDESKEKLSKLQPLPPLLEDFDLDSHVGLIQKLLKEDPTLVKMQATLSGNNVPVVIMTVF
jgi:hypothetical protein